MADHPWPEHITTMSSDRSVLRLDTLKDLKLFQNYNRLYHRNRLMYKEHLNNKMASLWNSRSSGSSAAENLKRGADDHYLSSYTARQRQEFQQSISESSSGKDFPKSTEKIWQQRVSKRVNPAGWVSDQEGHGQSCMANCPVDGFLPKLNSDQDDNKRIIKAKRLRAKQGNERVKRISAPTSLPNISRQSYPGHNGHSLNHNGDDLVPGGRLKVSSEADLNYSGHSDGQTASSMLNKFRYFIKMKSKAHNKSIQKDDSMRSLTKNRDSITNSLDSIIENRSLSPTVTAPKCNTIIQASSQLDKAKTKKSEETNKDDISKDAEIRPAQALHKVIFRTRDENGILVITAIGINQAALMR